MSQLNRFKRWLGLRTPDESAVAAQQPGQRLMTLDERMVFRREMVFEAVREVLASHGVPPLAFKLNVARLDNRGHRYAVMVDLLHTAGRVVESPGEWHAMERQMAHAADSRYRVKIASVYWRIERHGFESPQVQRPVAKDTVPPQGPWSGLAGAASTSLPHAGAPLATGTVGRMGPPPSVAMPTAGVRTPPAPLASDGFPDTVLEDRHTGGTEPIGPEELLAFEEALRAGQTPEKAVRLGKKTYQTDFIPLA